MTTRLSLVLVVVAGGVLRVVPIWFGLPYLRARPDEETTIGHALAILGGDPNPHFFHWPSLTFYLLAGLLTVSSWIRELFSHEPSLTPAQQILIGRALVAAAGTLTLLWLFWIGRRVAGAIAGVLAALFLAVAILHVRESHFAMTDVLMTLFVVMSLERLLQAVDVDRGDSNDRSKVVRSFAIAGVAGGLAASTKYSAAALLAAMAAAQIVFVIRLGSKRHWLEPMNLVPSASFVVGFAAAFLLTTPYALLDYRQFSEDFQYNMTHLAQGHTGDLGPAWMYHLVRSLPFGIGVLTCIAAVIGVVPLARHHRAQGSVLAAFALALYVAVGGGRTVFFRYVLPVVPIVCVAAAVGVRSAAAWCASRAGVPVSIATGLLTALVAIPSAVNCVWFDVLLARTDTRVLASTWLAANAQPTQSLAEAPDEYAQLELGDIVHEWYLDEATGGFRNAGTRIPDWLVLHESPLWTYAHTPASLRTLATERYELAFESRATRGAARAAVYDMDDAFFMPVSGFGSVERPGPSLFIYRKVR